MEMGFRRLGGGGGVMAFVVGSFVGGWGVFFLGLERVLWWSEKRCLHQ